GDETHTIGVVATVTNDDGLTTTSNDATTAVTDITPAILTNTISGTAQEGQVLTSNATANDVDAVLHYQWQSSSNGGTTWTDLTGFTASTYTVAETDETHLIRVNVSSTDSDGTSAAAVASTATTAVTDITPAILTNTISGTAQEGQVLTSN